MKITCPHCGLSGRVSEQKLRVSSGSVRCPGCQKTFTPIVKSPRGLDIPLKAPRPSLKAKTPKREEVLVGARSGDDVPFTHVMDDARIVSDDGIIVEIEGIEPPQETPITIDEEEILPLSDQDIVSEQDALVPPAGEIPWGGGAEGAEPDVFQRTPSRGLFGFLPGKKKAPPAGTLAPAPVLGRTAKKGIRGRFVIVLLFVLALWGGYWFFSTYWPPYVKEREFLADSRLLFDKYHELMVYLRVGLPDPVFATKVAETAYVWEVYREKHEGLYGKDPLFVSLTATGRLFLAVKELLDRDMSPDNFLGLEWGEGFPFVTKEQYVNAVVEGIPLCITAAEKDFQLTKEMLDHEADFNFVSVTLDRITKDQNRSERQDYVSKLKKANKDFMGVTSSMPVVKEAVLDITNMMKAVGEK